MEQIVGFLREIGIGVRIREIAHATFLPGIHIESGGLVVDGARLLYPGDLLHEAGHLALMDPVRRARADGDAGADAGEEMGAIAWSYAAALHIGIDPRVVFHDKGYKGSAKSIAWNFAEGRYLGVPVLQWKGLALEARKAHVQSLPAYPHMLRWLCE
jgi:hypothetical protein